MGPVHIPVSLLACCQEMVHVLMIGSIVGMAVGSRLKGWVPPDPVPCSSCRRSAALHVSGNRRHSALHVLSICSFQVFSASTMKTLKKVASIEVPKWHSSLWQPAFRKQQFLQESRNCLEDFWRCLLSSDRGLSPGKSGFLCCLWKYPLLWGLQGALCLCRDDWVVFGCLTLSSVHLWGESWMKS